MLASMQGQRRAEEQEEAGLQGCSPLIRINTNVGAKTAMTTVGPTQSIRSHTES